MRSVTGISFVVQFKIMTPPRQSVGFQTGKTTAALADFLVGDTGIEPATLPVGRANDTRVSSRHSARLTHESEADTSGRREAPLADEFLSRPRFFDCSRAWPYSWRRTLAQRWPQASPSLRQQSSLNWWMFMSPQKRLDVSSDKVRFAEVVERLCGRVDLVVMLRSREADKLCHILV